MPRCCHAAPDPIMTRRYSTYWYGGMERRRQEALPATHVAGFIDDQPPRVDPPQIEPTHPGALDVEFVPGTGREMRPVLDRRLADPRRVAIDRGCRHMEVKDIDRRDDGTGQLHQAGSDVLGPAQVRPHEAL